MKSEKKNPGKKLLTWEVLKESSRKKCLRKVTGTWHILKIKLPNSMREV